MNKIKTKIFAMKNAEKLGEKIAKELDIKLDQINRTVYADGEIIVSAEKTVRNKDVFVVASMATPVNDNIMELLLFIDSLKRASAKTITIVSTYYGYSRQDRKASGRQPIGAKLIADLIQTAGATKIIAVDLHNPSIQGFFNIPVDDLKGQYILASSITNHGKFTVVSPDHGGAVRARVLAELVSDTIQIAIVDKRRTGSNISEISGILGNVNGKNVVIIDDMIDTGGTIIKAAKALKEAGAKKIIVAATHGLFSRGFEEFDKTSCIDKVMITDSIESVHDIKSSNNKLEIISLANFLAKTILATADSKSVTEIYTGMRKGLNK